MKSILVEFFGIPRARAGVSSMQVCEGRETVTLGDVLLELSDRLPDFANACLEEDRSLRPGYLANIDGQRFVRGDEDQPLRSGQSVLILSSDAGG